MMTAAQINVSAAQRVFQLPLQIYDVALGERKVTLYVRSPKTAASVWADKMVSLPAGYRLLGSSEWYHSREAVLARHGEDGERDFVEGPREWTRTAFDFDAEEILEDIELRKDVPLDEIRENPRIAIASARRLGKKEGIELPHKSGYVNQMHPKYMPAVRQVWGVQNPEIELPDYTYLFIEPNGFRPVVCGDWHAGRRDGRRVNVGADYAPAGRFAARLVSDTKPACITPQEYAELAQNMGAREAELKAAVETELQLLKNQLDSAVVLILNSPENLRL